MRGVLKMVSGVVGMWMLMGVAGCIYVVPVEVTVLDKGTGATVAGAAVTTRYVGGAQAGRVRGEAVETDDRGRAYVRVLADPGKDGPAGTRGTEIHVEAAEYLPGRKIVAKEGDVKVGTLKTEAHVTGRAAEVLVELQAAR